jgi:hypothetical protein
MENPNGLIVGAVARSGGRRASIARAGTLSWRSPPVSAITFRWPCASVIRWILLLRRCGVNGTLNLTQDHLGSATWN